MGWTPIAAVALLALILTVGDVVALKTKGYISSIIIAMIALLIFGGTLGIIPADILQNTGVMPLVGTIVMPLILINVGSILDLNALKTEWKTIIVALAGLVGVVVMCLTVGVMLFGQETAYAAAGPISGGIVATMLVSEVANAASRPEIAVFAAAVMGMQTLVGLPLASVCLTKAAKEYIKDGQHKLPLTSGKQINFRLIPKTPKAIDNANGHLARLAIVAIVGGLLAQLTGLSPSITYLVGGIIFGAIGFIEKGSLRSAGADGFCLFVTWAFVLDPFLSMTLTSFGEMLPSIIGLLLIGAVGIIVLSVIAAKLLKWSPYLGIAVGLCCMLGYPITQLVATEVATGVTSEGDFTQEEKDNVLGYFLPKMLISGTISVSIASALIASVLAPMMFG